MSLLTCPGCDNLVDDHWKWCPSCGKWLLLIGPTASELYARGKALAARKGEALTPRKGMED